MLPGRWTIFGLWCMLPLNLHAQVPPTQDTQLGWEEAIEQLHACYADSLQQLQARDPNLTLTGHSEKFFFDQLSDENLEYVVSQKDVDAICETLFVQPLSEAFETLRSKKQGKSFHAMAGTIGFDSESSLIKMAVRLGRLDQVMGHSDITAHALDAFDDPMLGPSAVRLLSRTSQIPDLFLWWQEVAHAHTASSDLLLEPQTIEQHRQTFVAHIQQLLGRTVLACQNRQWFDAYVFLGTILHGIQDLVYHRGMTFSEHAGLSYYLHENPDRLDEPDFSRALNHAQQLSTQMLELLQSQLTTEQWQHFAQFEPNQSYDLYAYAKRLLPGSQPVTVTGMLGYWRLSLRYRFGPEKYLEGLRQATAGRWDIDTTFEQIVQKQKHAHDLDDEF